MNNKGVGAVFCLISAIIECTRYISAAIFMSNVTSWDSSLFQEDLNYTGSSLKVMAMIALVIGIGFLSCGVFQYLRKQ